MITIQQPVRRLSGFAVSNLAFAIGFLLPATFLQASEMDSFNPALLERLPGSEEMIQDLSVYELGGQAAGNYYVTVLLNNNEVAQQDVRFEQQTVNGKTRLQPCLSAEILKSWGVRTDNYPQLQPEGQSCSDFSVIPHAEAIFDFSNQTLRLSFPQAAVVAGVRSYVSPDKWDDGLTAAIMNYSLNSSNSYARSAGGRDNSSQFVSIRPGLNVGAWRIRNYSTWNRSSGEQGQWSNVYTYAQRGINALKGQLTLGDSTAPSDIFDGVPFRGAQIASDDEMLPESLRGYAPVVRGIARGNNAEVIVHQNGYIIYQANVPAGPFEITDLYPTGGSGDLLVTVREADGSEQQSIVPFATLPVMQREGHLRYSLTAGEYRPSDNRVSDAKIAQGTLIYGLPAGMTAYGGVQASENYTAFALGLGKNLGSLGALSADVMHSDARLKDGSGSRGQSMRLRYSKSMASTGTNVAIAGYRYSTRGFYTLSETLDAYREDNRTDNRERRRNRAELTLTQSLGQQAGYLSASLMREDYWNSSRQLSSWTTGYSNSWRGISYGINYSFNQNTGGLNRNSYNDQIISLSLSMPLSWGNQNAYAGYNMNSSRRGNTTHNATLSGTGLENNALNWSVSEGYGDRGQGNSGYTQATYRGTYGEVNGAYSYSTQSHNVNVGLNGSVLLHEDGLTLGQQTGETFALVKAPGAAGVSVSNQKGVKTDWRGYAIMPYASPYRQNEIALRTDNMPDDVDLTINSQKVVPTRGAIARADFKPNVGQRVLMTLSRADGRPVPFGATVKLTDSDVHQAAIVADQGEVYLSGLPPEGKLQVSWGKEAARQCKVSYILDKNITSAIIQTPAQCI